METPLFDALSIPLVLVFLGILVAGAVIEGWLERRASERRSRGSGR